METATPEQVQFISNCIHNELQNAICATTENELNTLIDLKHSFMRKKIILVQKGKGFSFDLLLGPVLGLAELVLKQPVHIA